MKQETIDLIVQLRDSGKSWFDVHKQVPNISPEQARRIYRETQGLNKPQNQISLRDYFAAKAMQSSLLKNTFLNEKEIAECSYLMADAMLEARVK